MAAVLKTVLLKGNGGSNSSALFFSHYKIKIMLVILGILLVLTLTLILFDKPVDQYRYKEIYKKRKKRKK